MLENNKVPIDKMVDEIIAKHEKKPENKEQERQNQQRQMPFRYLTDDEITEELNRDEENFLSKKIPDDPEQAAKYWKQHFVLGDSEKIEMILQKHENDKKIR